MAKKHIGDNSAKINIQLKNDENFKIPIDLVSQKALNTRLGAADVKKDYWGREYISDNDQNNKSLILTECKAKKIYSDVKIINKSANIISLGEFDYAVLNACISEKLRGNEFTTLNRIFHILGGGLHLYKPMKKAIIDSLERLSCVRVELDATDAVKKKILDDGSGNIKFTGYLLPVEYAETTINGKDVVGIHLLRGGFSVNNADRRNQIITCEQEALHPPVRTTPRTIAINHYLLRRSKTIEGSHDERRKRVTPLSNIIRLDDMYQRIGIADGKKYQKQDARETAIKILDFFVEKGIIKSYSIEKKDNKIHAFIIEFFGNDNHNDTDTVSF